MAKCWRTTSRRMLNKALFRRDINPLTLTEPMFYQLREEYHRLRNDNEYGAAEALVDGFTLGYFEGKKNR